MKLKKGVKITNLTPQMVLAIRIVESVYQRLEPWYDLTITSVDEGQHGPRTLHGKGLAVDFRTKDFNGNKYKLQNEVKAALGDDFDVVLEDMHGPQEHLHVELDPKG
jgi:hypothetical protein